MRASKSLFVLAFLLPLAAYSDQQVASGSEAMSRGQAIGIMAGWTIAVGGALAWVVIAENRGQGPNNTVTNTTGPTNTTGK